MCEEFVAAIHNLTSSEDRQTAKSWLSTVPSNLMVSVRGMFDSNVNTLSLLNIWTLSVEDYEKGRGNGMVFVPVSVYRELNKIGGDH